MLTEFFFDRELRRTAERHYANLQRDGLNPNLSGVQRVRVSVPEDSKEIQNLVDQINARIQRTLGDLHPTAGEFSLPSWRTPRSIATGVLPLHFQELYRYIINRFFWGSVRRKFPESRYLVENDLHMKGITQGRAPNFDRQRGPQFIDLAFHLDDDFVSLAANVTRGFPHLTLSHSQVVQSAESAYREPPPPLLLVGPSQEVSPDRLREEYFRFFSALIEELWRTDSHRAFPILNVNP